MYGSVSNVSSMNSVSYRNMYNLRKNNMNLSQPYSGVSFRGSLTNEVVKKGAKEGVKKLPVVLAAIAGFLGVKGLF